MSTIKSSTEHLTLNADGAGKEIKFQANGVEKASISSTGAFTSTSIDATKLSGALPAIDGSALTGTGKILQVVHYTDTLNRSTSSSVWVDTGISWSFSPALSNSRIIFDFSMAFAIDDQVQYGNARMLINGIERVKTAPTQGYAYSGRDESTFTKTIEHQCTSLSPVVVTFHFACADSTIFMNRPPRMASGYADVFTSTMTAMEIGA